MTNERTPTGLLELIIGKKSNTEFARPFIGAFQTVLGENDIERITATSIICALFLSSIKLKFPTEKLHAYTHNIREHHPIVPFDCNRYNDIYNQMAHRPLLLINQNIDYQETDISKEDIFEAFDFVTNI